MCNKTGERVKTLGNRLRLSVAVCKAGRHETIDNLRCGEVPGGVAIGRKFDHIQPDKLDLELSRHIPLASQVRYRYLVYVDGHCAANRYSTLMRMGVVVLKVASANSAGQLWFSPLLEPFADHVPVAADLSDLQEKIEWCHAHDDEGRKIAQTALRLAGRLFSSASVAGYLAPTLYAVASKQAAQCETVDPYTPVYSAHPPPSAAYLKVLRQVASDRSTGPA